MIIAGQVVPVKLALRNIRQEDGAAVLLQDRCGVLILLRVVTSSCGHRITGVDPTSWLVIPVSIPGLKPRGLLRLLDHWWQLTDHLFDCRKHQICVKLTEVNALLKNEPVLIITLWSFYATDVDCSF